MKPRSRPVQRKAAPTSRDGVGKRERNRRLTSLGLNAHDDEGIQKKALAIVARFLEWTTTRPSIVSGLRPGQKFFADGQEWFVGRIDPAHLQSRGAFGCDIGNVVPLTDHEHRLSHRDPDFFASRGLRPEPLARAHAIRFFLDHLDDADWMMLHANDGPVIQLASEAKAAA